MKRYCPDTNIFVTPWDETYPIDLFPSLWNELRRIKDQFILIDPILNEIDPGYSADKKKLSPEELSQKYPLRHWIEEAGIEPHTISDKIEKKALELSKEYQIVDKGKGANENDILLIAYVSQNPDLVLVTLEAEQKEEPKKKRNYKIPLICKKENIPRINFITLLREMKIKL